MTINHRTAAKATQPQATVVTKLAGFDTALGSDNGRFMVNDMMLNAGEYFPTLIGQMVSSATLRSGLRRIQMYDSKSQRLLSEEKERKFIKRTAI
jgi:hypothetical protein